MNNKLLLFLLLTIIGQVVSAQDYSYIQDRKFKDTESLLGYDFKPSGMEIPNERSEELDPGDYSFGITMRNLYVEGEEIRGVYTLNNIAPTEYGYKITTMNARDARIQGHLKVILTPRKYVEALIFRRSQEDPEIIFTLPMLDEDMDESEKAYFTDLKELEIEHKDSIWGTTIYPFIRVYGESGVQERLHDYDSTFVHFEEVITVEEKIKKVKEAKPKKEKNNKGETEEIEEEELDEELDKDLLAEMSVKDSIEVKTKITKTYFIHTQSLIRYDDGTEKIEKKKYEIKKIVEKEDETAGENEERFQLEVENNKGVPVFLYLNGKRTVSSIEIGDKIYLMRGW